MEESGGGSDGGGFCGNGMLAGSLFEFVFVLSNL